LSFFVVSNAVDSFLTDDDAMIFSAGNIPDGVWDLQRTKERLCGRLYGMYDRFSPEIELCHGIEGIFEVVFKIPPDNYRLLLMIINDEPAFEFHGRPHIQRAL
jgi:hypothetical protein